LTTSSFVGGVPPSVPFSETAIAPEVDDRRAIESIFEWLAAASQVGDPNCVLRKQRDERHTTHYWFESLQAGVTRRFFVKRYRPPLERNLFTFALRSRVEREYANSRQALELGIPSLPAIGYAQRRRFGVVVDQVIVFHDVGKCKSATQLIEAAMENGEEVSVREEISSRFARDLKSMHERGYSHLSVSPRNYLKVLSDGRFVIIDHNAAIVFPRSIHATSEAVPDLLNLFESRRLLPDDSTRAEFLRAYAPDSAAFRAQVTAAVEVGRRSDRAARAQKLRSIVARAMR